ncbi:helix-turn-helix transcriptional regulator [Sutcliffiella horikoshii]|uniref:helix-turn-helix transcriptional regulator n=1 Tax=Sutcliffiella horikoshii TaxID=79883 RepID=UPI001653A11E|nr:helix-turn-helix transcriptional regulator [Sutcliffiella horikoshii]
MGNNIKELREDLSLSQKDLARKLKISEYYMNKIENGKENPSVRLAIRMAHILNCRVEDLFFEN